MILSSRPPRPLWTVVLTTVFATSCVHPVSTSWRLSNNILTPPGVSKPTLTQRTVISAAAGKPVCPQGVRTRPTGVQIKVTRDGLANHPPGWLTAWTEDLEAQGCIVPGEAFRLATRIAQSLPLEPNAGFQLLYPRDSNLVEIDPGVRLQIMTPIVKEGAAPDAPLIEATTTVSGSPDTGIAVNINGRFTDNVLGYETTWYSVQPKNRLPGVTVAPTSTERHIGGTTDNPAQPIRNYFQSLNEASFYGLFYKGGQTEFTALIVGGVTKADLDRRTKILEADTASCELLKNEMCVVIPKRAAVNPMVLVTLNGREKLLNWGATVNVALNSGGVRQPSSVLPQLSISKPYGDGMAPLQFDHSDSAVLNLILMGGESISWK